MKQGCHNIERAKLPRNLVHVVLSLMIGYFTAAVLTGRNLKNWANQLPISEPNQELDRLVEKHAKRSAKFGGSEITEKLEKNFFGLHNTAKNPIFTKEPLPEIRALSVPQKLLGTRSAGKEKSKTLNSVKKTYQEPPKKRQNEGGKVLLIGDSLMAGLGPALKLLLANKQNISSRLITKIGTGLARPDRYNWSEALKGEFKNNRYRTVVLLLGTNDTQNIKIGGKGLLFGGPTWHSTYAARVHELMTTTCKASEQVYWLGLPPMRDPEFNLKASHLNTVIKSIASSHKCVRYVAISQGASDSKYTAYLSLGNRQIKVRAPDGIHYTPAGAKIVSELLLPKILTSDDKSALSTFANGSTNHKQTYFILGDN